MKPCAHLKKPSTNSVGNWSAEEDEAILRYVYSKEQTGDSMMWGNLQHSLNGRSGKSCRERWFNHLDPKIKRCDWTVEEQWVLFILRNQQNEKWSLISKILLGRTDNAVKNYWNSRLRKRIDNMQKAYEQHFERKKKQKILTYLEASGWNEQTSIQEKTKKMNDKEDMSKQTLAELEKNLNEAQQKELKETMEKLKADYLHKMIEQIEKQNIEYYNELACEYELQMQKLKEVSGASIFNNQAQIQNDGGLDIGSPRFQDQAREDNKQPDFFIDEYQLNQQTNQQATLSNIQQDHSDLNFQGIAQEKLVQQQDITRNKIFRFESFSSDQIDEAVEILEDALPEKFVTKEKSPYKNGVAHKSDNSFLGIAECEEEDYESQLSQLYIFRSAATLKMHLEILYKSVGFLNRKQIMSELSKYKEGKEKEQLRLKEIRKEQEDAVGRRRGRKKEVKDFDTSPYAGLKLSIRKGSASNEIYENIDDVEMEDEDETESEEDESDEITEEIAKKQTRQKQEFVHDFKKKNKKGEEIPDLSRLSEKKKNQRNFGMKKNVSFPNKKTINNIASSNKFQDSGKGLESNILFEGSLKRSDILSRNKTGKNGTTQTGISGDLVKTRSDNFNSHEANGPPDEFKHQREQEDIYLVLSGSDSDASQNYRKGKNRQAGSGELKRTLNGLDNYDSDSSDSLSSLRSKVSKHSKLSCQTNQALKKIKKQKKKSKYIQKIFLTEKLQKNQLGKDPLIQSGKIQPINEQEKIYQISCFTPQPYREMYPREYGQIQGFGGYTNHNSVPNFQPQNSWVPPVMNQHIQDKHNSFAMFQNQQHQQFQILPPDQRLDYPSPSLSTRMNDLNLITPQVGKNQGFVAHINPSTTNFLGGPNQQGVEFKNISSVSFGPNQAQTSQNSIYMNQERSNPQDISYMFNNNVQTNLSGLSFNNSSYVQGHNNSKLAGFFSQQRIDNRVSGQYAQNIDSNEIFKSSKIQNERIISAKFSKISQNHSKYNKIAQSKNAIQKGLARQSALNSKHNTPQIGQAKQRVIIEGTNESLFYQNNDEKINQEIGQDLDSRFMMKSKSARQIPYQIGFQENLWRPTNFQTIINEQKVPQDQLKIEGQNGHLSNTESQFRVANFSSNAFQVREISSNGRVPPPLSGLNQVPQLQHVFSQNQAMVQRGNSMNQPWQSQNSSDSVLSFSQNFSNINHAKQPTLDRQIHSMYTGPSNSLIGYNTNQQMNYSHINQNGGQALANLHPSQQYSQNSHYLNSQQQNQQMYQQQHVDYPYRNNAQVQYVNQTMGQGQQIQLVEQQSPFIRLTNQIQSGIQTSVTQGTTGFQSWINAVEKERPLTRASAASDPNIKNEEFEPNKLPEVGNTSVVSIKDIKGPQSIDQQMGFYNSQPKNFQKINHLQNMPQVNDLSFAQSQPMMLNNGSNPEMNLQHTNYNNNVMYLTQQNQFVKNNNQLGQNSAFIPGQHHIHQINIQPGLSILSSQDSQTQIYGQIQNQQNQQQQILGSSYDKNSIGVNGTQSHENTGSQDYKIAIQGINKNKNENSHGHSDNLNTRDQQDEHLIERIEEIQNELSHVQGQNTFVKSDGVSQGQVGKSEKRIFHTNNFMNSTTAQLSKLQKNDNFRASSISNCKLMYNSMTGGRRGQSQARQSKQLIGSHTEINPDYNEMLSPDVTSGSDTRLSNQNYGRIGGSGGQDISNQMIPGIMLNSSKKTFITPFQKLAEGRTSNF